ncbi:unnamed protein product [Enterobius vermicularis]|uniref:G_PROTEIN_RECEP_F1_2 domain-containing protein n=1 Tax=Enterobius vermicularis TaxID=51028 RepID=A0A0N4VQ01_ENTVE|nr:unnamed protein product [Enterobius vermicularis]
MVIVGFHIGKYIVILFPTKRKRQRNLALLLFLLIWLISVVLALPMLIASDIQTIFDDCLIILQICQENDQLWQKIPLGKQSYTLAILITQYALPLISIVFVYTRIWQRMKVRLSVRMSSYWANRGSSYQQRKSAADRRRRTNLLFGCIVIIFALAWLPLNVFHVLWTFRIIETFPVPVFAVCHLAAMLSSCLNPVSYAFFNNNFREQFAKMFHSLPNLIRISKLWQPVPLAEPCRSSLTLSRKPTTDRQKSIDNEEKALNEKNT